jgi:hypothetical protein
MRKKIKILRAVCILLPIIGLVLFLGDWIVYAVSVKEAYPVDHVYESGWHTLLMKGIRTTVTGILVFVTILLMQRDYLKNGNYLTKKQIDSRSKLQDYTCLAFSVINIVLIIVQWILLRYDYLCIDDEEIALAATFKHYLWCLYYFAIYDTLTLILVIAAFKSVNRNLSEV